MFDPDFWEKLEYRLAFYNQILKESKNEENILPENQNKSERRQYEDKLDHFIQLKFFYNIFY